MWRVREIKRNTTEIPAPVTAFFFSRLPKFSFGSQDIIISQHMVSNMKIHSDQVENTLNLYHSFHILHTDLLFLLVLFVFLHLAELIILYPYQLDILLYYHH